jgi:hypothetical protein
MPTRHAPLPPFGPQAALARTVDAVNAAGPPRGRLGDRALVAALDDVLRAHGEPERLRARGAQVAGLRDTLGRLHAVLVEPDADRAAAGLNALLADVAGPPRLVREPGTPWHVHVHRDENGSWAAWLAASGAMALALALADAGEVPWGTCAADGCERVHVHDGRGGARRFCSTRCATRSRVAALRARRAAA